MSFVLGTNVDVTVDGDDLTIWIDASEIERTREALQVTTYGKTSHVYVPGLKDGKFTLSGSYDNTAVTGSRAVLLAAYDAAAPITVVRMGEGVGAGKPQDSFSAIITKYAESAPVADVVKWSAEIQLSDTVTTTAQV